MFKKSLVRFIAFAIVISLFAITLSGCMFIQENENRVANKDVITVKGPNGITLTITRNEILDYFNSYAYYLINYYSYTAETAMDFAIESKIKNKYLIAVAMGYLTTDVSQKRKDVLFGEGRINNPEDVLTFAEYYAAIATVNKTIEDTIKEYVDTDYQSTLNREVTDAKLKKTEIKEIKYTEETLDYLKEEYYVGQSINKDKIKFVIVYDDKSESKEMIVPKTMYTTEFSTEAASESSSLTIKFDEKIENSDGSTSYESHEATHEYKVIEARATKNKEEEVKPDEISIGDIKVDRYATLQEINEAGAAVAKLNVEQKYKDLQNDPSADTYQREAYRLLIEQLTGGNKTMDYLYKTALESAVITALQAEVEKTITDENDDDYWDDIVLKEYKYLYESAKEGYINGKDEDLAFAKSITSGLSAYYYHPETENLDGYFYVYQILFNFSQEQKDFLSNYTSSEKEDLKKDFYMFMRTLIETKQSNPKYDAEYKCPVHAEGNTGGECKWETDEENDGGLCPSIAYVMDDEGNYELYKFMDIYTELQTQLLLDMDESMDKAYKTFEDYMYMYNDDGGIMNSANGYLIVPGDEDPNGFYKEFIDLAKSVYDYDATVGNAFVLGDDGEKKLGFTFTDYGVHIIMVSMKPFDNGDELIFANDDEMISYMKSMYINADKTETIYSALKKKVITAAKSQVYSDFTSASVDTNLHEDTSKVTKDNKAIEKIYKDNNLK